MKKPEPAEKTTKIGNLEFCGVTPYRTSTEYRRITSGIKEDRVLHMQEEDSDVTTRKWEIEDQGLASRFVVLGFKLVES